MSVQPSASTVDEATRSTTASPSGRLLLRMPPGLHAELTRAAERDGVSLNGYITSRLGESVGWRRAEPTSTAVDRKSPPQTIVWVLIANAIAIALAAAVAVVIVLVAVLG